jgi:hypothetical protein
MNYTELTTLLQQYLENEEASYIDNIPVFVRLCEEDIYRTVRLPAVGINATSTLTLSNQYLGLPTGFLSPHSLAVIVTSEHRYLLNKDIDFIREAFPNPATVGVPRYYAQFDQDNFIVGPTPDSAYTVELHYFAQPESLTTVAGGETWLSRNAENAMLFGSLLHGYIYMKGDQDVLVAYKGQYEKAIADLKRVVEQGSRTDDYRMTA